MLRIDLHYPVPQRQTFKPVGRCIYCGSGPEAGKLTREHIIAHGLSGTLILPEASCESCAETTGGLEGFYLQKMIRDARIHMKLASRRHRRNKAPPPALTIDRRLAPDVTRRVELAAHDHPYWLVTLGYAPPGVLIGAADDYAPLIEHSMIPGDNWPDRWHRAGPGVEVEYLVDANLFARMLAKIAHSFAVAALGINGFAPTLNAIILGTEPRYAKYVGGCYREDEDRSARPGVLHSIGIERQDHWFVVRLRLFAHLEGAPSYVIVAGRAP